MVIISGIGEVSVVKISVVDEAYEIEDHINGGFLSVIAMCVAAAIDD